MDELGFAIASPAQKMKKRPLPLSSSTGLVRTPRTPRRRKVLRSAQSPKGGGTSPARTPRGTPSVHTPGSDRFIASRTCNDFDLALRRISSGEDANAEGGGVSKDCEQSVLRNSFRRSLRDTLLADDENADPEGGSDASLDGRVLHFRCPRRVPQRAMFRPALQVVPSSVMTSSAEGTMGRHISGTPLRILDAPDLVDDYYLNLIHWSSTDVLAVALGASVYLWDAKTSAIEHLVQLDTAGDFVTSVNWSRDGKTLAVGTNNCAVQLYDAEALRLVRQMSGHHARVGSLSWQGDGCVTSGSRDAQILHHDARARRGGVVHRFSGHHQEVCGLRWNSDGTALASGGNENFLCLWDARGSGPRLTLTQHNAAVKALAWAPFSRHLLASGGGTADRCIRLWNTSSGACQQSVDTGSQVCSLLWSPHSKELLSSHGFSENQLVLWKYPQMQRVKELRGHTARVLHMATSPDATTVVSAASDETLRFWNVFGSPPAKAEAFGSSISTASPSSRSMTMMIR